jgi:hypothetical protein
MKYVENITKLGEIFWTRRISYRTLVSLRLETYYFNHDDITCRTKFVPNFAVQRQTYIRLGLTPNNSNFRPERIPASINIFFEYTKKILSCISAELTLWVYEEFGVTRSPEFCILLGSASFLKTIAFFSLVVLLYQFRLSYTRKSLSVTSRIKLLNTF